MKILVVYDPQTGQTQLQSDVSDPIAVIDVLGLAIGAAARQLAPKEPKSSIITVSGSEAKAIEAASKYAAEKDRANARLSLR